MRAPARVLHRSDRQQGSIGYGFGLVGELRVIGIAPKGGSQSMGKEFPGVAMRMKFLTAIMLWLPTNIFPNCDQ